MTIEEIENLIIDERNKMLRNPQSMENESVETILMAHQIFKTVIDNVLRNSTKYKFLNSVAGKQTMQKYGISKISCINRAVGVYEIETKLGKGTFFDAHRLFQDDEYPRWIRHHQCFANAHLYILKTKMDAKVLSGIAFVGKPFLHSVLLVGDDIIDFNYDLIMSKDLYCALTHFEVLAELDSTKLLENKRLIMKIRGVQGSVFNFAFDEVVEQEKQKLSLINAEIGAC